MNLHEYQTKQLLVKYGLSVPIGYICTTPTEAEEVALKIHKGKGPWIMKCQIHSGGRSKSGGVKIVNNKKEVKCFANYWLGKRLVTNQSDVNGQLVNKILLEELTDIDQELYLGAVIDFSIRRIMIMASRKGGVDIEKVARKSPDLIHKIVIDPLTGPQKYQGRSLAFKLGLNGNQVSQFTNIFISLVTMFLELDLSFVEINPLVITKNNKLICLDGKLSVDDNALFRQPYLEQMRDLTQEDPREALAAKWELNYVALEGNIGCMVNGAGLAMGTMDIIKHYGGSPANFLDVGGAATKERVTEAFKIILSDKSVKAIFINIFGGIVRCDLIADGIIIAINKVNIKVPIVVRLEGNNSELGSQKLIKSGLNIIVATSFKDAAKKVIAATRG